MASLRVLELSGTPYDMGYRHGQTYAAEIREMAEERFHLCSEPIWTGGQRLSREQILALAELCLEEHRLYSPELMQELEGMAAATGLSMSELVILNGFTDFVDVIANYQQTTPVAAHPASDNCTAFIVPAKADEGGQGFIGQTWDMHATATPFVILMRGKPADKPAFLLFTIIGCVGMIGLNEAGIAVGINNLLGADGQPGVTWPFVIRKALMQTSLDDALKCITSAKLAGAHNYILADSSGRGYNVEAMSQRHIVEEVQAASYVHTNHCIHSMNLAVERKRLPESQLNSEQRLNRAQVLLQDGKITLDTLMALTRDQTGEYGICQAAAPPFFVESCGAVIMRPATREFWAVWGPPVNGEYERFVV